MDGVVEAPHELAEVMETWLSQMEASASTRRMYERQVRSFLAHNDLATKPPGVLCGEHLDEFLESMRAAGASANTAAAAYSAVGRFARYLKREGIVPRDFSRGVRAPEQVRAVPAPLSRGEITRLLAAPDRESAFGLRDAAILELLYSTGMEISAVVTLSVEDLDQARGTLNVKTRSGQTKAIQVPELALAALIAYRDVARESFERTNEPSPALFLTSRGKGFTRQGLWKLLRRYAAAVGLSGPLNQRVLRQTYIAHCIDAGADDDELSERLGHGTRYTMLLYREKYDERIDAMKAENNWDAPAAHPLPRPVDSRRAED